MPFTSGSPGSFATTLPLQVPLSYSVKSTVPVGTGEKVRAAHPGKVLDVVHADFHRQPMAVLERIYGFIGMDIPDDTRAALARRIEDKPELARGVHRYDIAAFGMTEEQARAPFGDYIQRYDLVETHK